MKKKSPKETMSRRRALKFATAGAGAIGVTTLAAKPVVAATPTVAGTSIAETPGDQTAEIQAALDAAFDSGGDSGLVRLEEGTFNISSPLIRPDPRNPSGQWCGNPPSSYGRKFRLDDPTAGQFTRCKCTKPTNARFERCWRYRSAYLRIGHI